MSDTAKSNPLLQVTRTEILERQLFAKDTFADEFVLAAIEAYENQGSPKRRAQDFVNSLLPLWSIYEKETCVPLFKNFVEIEFGLESFETGYSTHANHVIQEFLFGYNTLLKCERYLSDFDYDRGRKNSRSKFGSFFFSWMAASLFHDVGYDIEKAYEEESFRKKKNSFWDFMTKRSITDNPITFSDAGPARRLLERFILTEIRKIPGAPRCSYVEFEELFRYRIPEQDWVRYDHGIISALKYLTELQKLETERGGNYLRWKPNQQAALAMALHNFRYKSVDLQLSSTSPNTVLVYLLIISDEVQEWERERIDVDDELSESVLSKKNARRETKLVGISFKSDYVYVVIDHRLKDPLLRDTFEDYLFEKIVLQKKHFPIQVKFPAHEARARDESIKKIVFSAAKTLTTTMAPFNVLPLIDITSETINTIRPLIKRASKVNKIAKTVTEKQLLIPSEPNIYQVYVDHRIDGKPFLVTVFPF